MVTRDRPRSSASPGALGKVDSRGKSWIAFDFGTGKRFREEVKVAERSLAKRSVRNECRHQVPHAGWIIKVQN